MKSSQREKKQEKKNNQKLVFDEKIFSMVNVTIPLTSSEAQTIANSFMDHLKSILEVNLSIIAIARVG